LQEKNKDYQTLKWR